MALVAPKGVGRRTEPQTARRMTTYSAEPRLTLLPTEFVREPASTGVSKTFLT
jgi:hypothetical protein